MKRAIVTGATSMLGVALIETCVQNNTPVVAVVRPGSSTTARLPRSDMIDVIECDIACLDQLPHLVEGKGGIFYHFAWSLTGSNRNRSVEQQCKNIQFSLDAVHAAKLMGCEAFIGAGSQAEYGILNVSKAGPSTPTNPTTPYGICKYTAGKLSLIECERLSIRGVWARIFSVYGKYDKSSSMISSTLDKMLEGKPTEFTQAVQLWDYLYSEDAGRAFYLLGDRGKHNKVYCVGSGHARPLSDYLDIIASIIEPKHDLGIGRIPYGADAIMSLCADIDDLTNDTGFHPWYDFREGIEKTIRFKEKELYERRLDSR